MSFEFLSSTTYPWIHKFKIRCSINDHNRDRFLSEHAGVQVRHGILPGYALNWSASVGGGGKLISARAIEGIATPNPDTPPPYQVLAIMEVESLEFPQDVLEAHGAEIMGNIPNFTDVEPVIQISENLG